MEDVVEMSSLIVILSSEALVRIVDSSEPIFIALSESFDDLDEFVKTLVDFP